LCSTHKGCGSDDKTPDDNVRRLQSAQLGLADAINTAAEQAIGRSNLTSLEIDLANGDTVVWQIKFGGKVTTGPPQCDGAGNLGSVPGGRAYRIP
jgi:hypothetical protein